MWSREIGRETKMKILKKTLLAIAIVTLLASTLAPLAFVKAQDQPLFSVTIVAPGNANLVRRQWAQIFASSLNQLGIDAKVVYLGWDPVYERCLTPATENVGKIWDDGGWDILALGWTPGLLPEPRQLYYGGPGFFAPDGQNYPLWNDPDSNAQLDTFITATDPAIQENALKAWQQIYYDEMPASQIMYQSAPAIVNPHITNWYTAAGGEGWLYFNAQPYPELLKRDDGVTRLVYCTTGEIADLVPPVSNSWYDTVIFGNIYNGLAQPWPTLNSADEVAVPNLLTSWTPSTDGFTWTFNCREGVTWHDGAEFTADDVVFSIWALMNSDVASQFVGYYKSVYGDPCTFTYSDGTSVTLGEGTKAGNVTATGKYTIEAKLPELTGGKPYGYFDPYLLGFANNIIPKHIFENVADADWKTSCFNTGQGSVTIGGTTYTGPVGTGPYKWESFDPVAQIVHLTKNDEYWNATALEAEGMFGITDYYIQFIADKTSALAALKNGEVDILDAQYQMQLDVPTVESSWGKVLLQEGTGRQEFGYNMQHPVFGTGVDTPLGKSDPSKAAEAARHVRIAFDYAIPRQLIIDNLLDGFGEPGITPMVPSQPFFESSLSARPYDLTQARQHLQLAGYSPTGETSGVTLQGTLAYANGTARPTTSVDLMFTTDNSTFPDSLQLVTQITTNANGAWSFTVNPLEPGTYHYYLMDNSTGTPEYMFVQSYTVASPSPSVSETPGPIGAADYTWVIIVAVVVVIVVVAVAVLFARKRKK